MREVTLPDGSRGIECCNAVGHTGPTGFVGIAALPPCSPATASSRRVLGGYVSPEKKSATMILKKIRMILARFKEVL